MERPFGVRGFTILELLVVLTLVVVLASIGMVQYQNSVRRTQESVLKENLFRMRDAINQFYADKSRYPDDLTQLVQEGYIRAIPEDSITRSKDTWLAVQAPPDPNDPASGTGIYDVKSGSDQVALDGTRYADWN